MMAQNPIEAQGRYLTTGHMYLLSMGHLHIGVHIHSRKV